MPVTSASLGVFNYQGNPNAVGSGAATLLSGVQLNYQGTGDPPVNGVATLFIRLPDGRIEQLVDSINLQTDITSGTANFGNVPVNGFGVQQGVTVFAVITQDNGATITTPDSAPFNIYCFLEGTLIATPSGEMPVEALRRGDLVRTADGRDVPVLFVGWQAFDARFADRDAAWPIRIRAGALAEHLPARDLYVSPDHALLLDGVLCAALALVNGETIAQVPPPGPVLRYFSLELEAHEVILAEGAPAESFMDHVPRSAFHNHAEFVALYPEGRTIEELPLPVARSHRQVPAEIRAALAVRAAALRGMAAAA